MLKIIRGRDASEHMRELNLAFQLRHRIFVEEMGWENLRSADGREIDQFDHDAAVHFLLYGEGNKLIGYQRLLPTTRPHLLSEVHPHLCEVELPRGPEIYEWTRFAVDRDHRGEDGGLGRAGAELVLGYVSWGLANGVSAVVVEVSPFHLLKFVDAHFMIDLLGRPQRIGNEMIMAVLAKFDHQTQVRLERATDHGRKAGGAAKPVKMSAEA
ncbi:MAG: GNAT family N-acetyltransferase [Burkholderiaceae bacterium]|nr:GNAT family N-acetyltransferase [Burkholderiaceae bacterium]